MPYAKRGTNQGSGDEFKTNGLGDCKMLAEFTFKSSGGNNEDVPKNLHLQPPFRPKNDGTWFQRSTFGPLITSF